MLMIYPLRLLFQNQIIITLFRTKRKRKNIIKNVREFENVFFVGSFPINILITRFEIHHTNKFSKRCSVILILKQLLKDNFSESQRETILRAAIEAHLVGDDTL